MKPRLVNLCRQQSNAARQRVAGVSPAVLLSSRPVASAPGLSDGSPFPRRGIKAIRNSQFAIRNVSRGFTLIEALAGSILLATLLVTVLLAKGNLARQNRQAADRVEACQVLEGLLNQWWSDRSKFPRNGEGEVPGQAAWRWQTHVLDNPQAKPLHAEVVAVALYPADGSADQPAARVEVLLTTDKDLLDRDKQELEQLLGTQATPTSQPQTEPTE